MEDFSLIEQQKRRALAVEKYREFIDKWIEPINGKPPKGIRFRRWARNTLLFGASKVFDTEAEEYAHVCKPGRGVWDYDALHLKKSEIPLLLGLAMDYGAYDY